MFDHFDIIPIIVVIFVGVTIFIALIVGISKIIMGNKLEKTLHKHIVDNIKHTITEHKTNANTTSNCEYCGSQLNKTDEKCPNCGAKIMKNK